MNIIKANVTLINPPLYSQLLNTVELAGRVCYKSEQKITYGSAEAFVHKLIERGHEAVIEHGSITIKFVCDRGVSHEIVRHRLASYCQESTRYCNYSNDQFGGEITVIKPCFTNEGYKPYEIWYNACLAAEKAYFDLLDVGWTPQEARSVLPNSLKTEVVMTANIREWRHFIKLRASNKAHPQMREVANKVKELLKKNYPAFFEDL